MCDLVPTIDLSQCKSNCSRKKKYSYVVPYSDYVLFIKLFTLTELWIVFDSNVIVIVQNYEIHHVKL